MYRYYTIYLYLPLLWPTLRELRKISLCKMNKETFFFLHYFPQGFPPCLLMLFDAKVLV